MNNVSNSSPIDQAGSGEKQARTIRHDATADAWKIVAGNPSLTLAVFLIQMPLTYLLTKVPPEESLRMSYRASAWYEMFVSGFVTFGVYRCVLASARTGQTISLRMVFSEGFPYWGRNFRLSWVLGLYYLGIGILILLPTLLAFATVAAASGGDDTITYLAAGLVALVGIILAMPRILRLSLSTAWLADSQHGARTRAQDAAKEALAMTKGRDLWPLYRALGTILLGHLALIIMSMIVNFILEQGIEESLAADILVWAEIALSLPYALLSALISTIFAVLYLDYSESSEQGKSTLKTARGNVAS